MRTPFTTEIQKAYNTWRLAAAIFGEHSAEADNAAQTYVTLDTQEKQLIRTWATLQRGKTLSKKTEVK